MVVSSRFLEATGAVAGVEEREAPGAVGGLDHARREAGLADGGGLLVAGDAADAHWPAEDRRLGRPVVGIAVAHLRQDRARHIEKPQQVVVEGALGDIVEQRARGIGGIGGMHPAAGQPPQQEGVDGAEGEMAVPGERARALDVVEQPGDLGGGEIGIEQQPGLGRDRRLVPRQLQRPADVGRAPVLPDDGAVDRLAAAPVPDEAGLALVGDADGGNVGGGEPGGGDRLPRRLHRRAPDVLGVVLDPAGGRIVLGKLALPRPQSAEVGAEHDGAARRRALIDRQNRPGFGHALLPFRFGAASPIANPFIP